MSRGEPGAVIPRQAGAGPGVADRLMETEVNPFHCLYQDALYFHTQSRLHLVRSESEANRLARAAILLYLSAAEALVRQAAVDLGRPEPASLLADPRDPIPLAEACRVLPAISADGKGRSIHLDSPPWPQFLELLALRDGWLYPGPGSLRKAYYRSASNGVDFEPLQPHEIPRGLGLTPDRLYHPRTGIPRDPYALRPDHLDTARGVIDAVVESLDQALRGSLTKDNRHRREPVRLLVAR